MTSNGKLIKDAMDAAGKDRETKQHPPKGRNISSKSIMPKQMTSYATGGSIVDYLDSIGQDSSKDARAVLAKKHNIENYTGTADQNTELLNALQSNKAISSSVKGKQKRVDFTNVYQGSLTTNSKFQQAASKQVLPSMYDAMINNPMNGGDHSGATLSAQQQAMQNNLSVGPGKQPLKKFTAKDAAALKKMGYIGDMNQAANTQNQIDSVANVNQGFHTSTGVNAFRSIPLPENIKANALYLSNRLLGVGDNRMNQDNLSDEQKLVLYKAYKDQLTKHPDQANHGAISYSNYGDDISNQAIKGEGSMLSKIGRSFTDPAFEMSHTIGGANYWSAPNSDDVYITDKYDFNNKGDKTKKKFETPNPSAYQSWRNMMGDVEKTNPSQADLYDRDVNIKLSKKQMEELLASQQPKKTGGSTFSGNAWYKGGGSTFSGNAWYDKGGIHINPANKGKFNATKKATGKTTEELTHSSNPVTRKRAIFAQNAAKWHHAEGGSADITLPQVPAWIQNYQEPELMAPDGVNMNPTFTDQGADIKGIKPFQPVNNFQYGDVSSVNTFTTMPNTSIETKGDRFKNKMNKLADGLMDKTFGDPFSLYNMAGYATNIVDGINNHKKMRDEISRENFNYSTMGMNPVVDPGDGARGFRPVSGTQRNKEIPNRIGGNYSFNGMNQANYNPYRAALGLSVDDVYSPGEMYSVPMQSAPAMPQVGAPQTSGGPSAPNMTEAPTPIPEAPDAAPNMNLSANFADYANKAQQYLSQVNPDTDITGQMLAASAQKAYEKTGKVVPVELALAQLQQEGYLAKGPKNKPQRTKNPFNVGNTDDGKVVNYNNVQSGIDKYFHLMTTQYLSKKSPEDLLKNFTNNAGHRYAMERDYEAALKMNIANYHKKVHESGGVVEMTGDQIMQLRALGGDVEFID